MDAKKQGGKSLALESIPAHPNTTGGTPEIELAVKAVRLKTLTEIGSTFNSGQRQVRRRTPPARETLRCTRPKKGTTGTLE